MRTILLAALLAGAAAPALAAPGDRFDRREGARPERADRAERAEPTERAPERTERAQPRAERSPRRAPPAGRDRAERPPVVAPAGVERRPLRSPRAERGSVPASARVAVERRREITAPVRGETAPRIQELREAARDRDSVRDWRANERRLSDSASAIHERNMRRAPLIDRSGEDLARSPGAAPRTGRSGDGLVQPTRPLPRVLDRDPTRVSRRRPAPGAQPPEPATARLSHARPSRHWRTDWRRDRRFDWRDHRRRHRSHFHLGFYYDPFGWSYRRYGIGWRLWPSYYSHRYWLNDPWMYRLPPAYGPYRWVRYWDDALLVNIYTGQVVDVIHNFFW